MLSPPSMLTSPPTSPSTTTTTSAMFANCPPTYRHLWDAHHSQRLINAASHYYPVAGAAAPLLVPSSTGSPYHHISKLRILERSELNENYKSLNENSSCSSSLNSSSSDVEVGAEDTVRFSCPVVAYSDNEQCPPTVVVQAGDTSSHQKPKLSFSIEALIGIK